MLRPEPTPLLWRDDGGPVVDREHAERHLSLADPALGRIISRVGSLTLAPPTLGSPFHYLQRAIVYQQLSGKAAATIFGRFLEIYGGKRPPSARRILATPDAKLRGAGLSGAKIRAIKDLARHAEIGTIPGHRDLPGLESDEIVERLCRIRGIGRWTAEMLLIFYLGHPDVLPLGDLGIMKGFAVTVGMRRLPAERTMARRGERWRPYRSIASWYLWRAVDLGLTKTPADAQD